MYHTVTLNDKLHQSYMT